MIQHFLCCICATDKRSNYILGLLLSYGSWIYNYMCNQFLSPLTLWVQIPFRRGVLYTTLCDKICQWFSPGTPVSSTNKTDRHNIAEILLKVALNTINHNHMTRNGMGFFTYKFTPNYFTTTAYSIDNLTVVQRSGGIIVKISLSEPLVGEGLAIDNFVLPLYIKFK